jgi:hypothetical protein
MKIHFAHAQKHPPSFPMTFFFLELSGDFVPQKEAMSFRKDGGGDGRQKHGNASLSGLLILVAIHLEDGIRVFGHFSSKRGKNACFS